MKRKMITSIAAMALLLAGLATVAFAAGNWMMPAQVVSGFTGTTAGQQQDRQAAQGYGDQADADKLSQAQQERLAQCKQWLDQAVKNGQMTQAEADKLYEAMKTRMAACFGSVDTAGNANIFGYGMMGRGMMGRGSLVSGMMGGGCGLGYGQGQNVN